MTGLLHRERALCCLRVTYHCVRSNEMIEAVLDKGFAQCVQRTNDQGLRKEVSLLVRFLKQNCLLGSQGAILPFNPMAENLSPRPFGSVRYLLHMTASQPEC